MPKGILVSGIPGSGKSLMAKSAARKLELPLISIDMGAL
ncbi:MAG: AAA family ATPase, partial [Kiritimatiellae bacterium]|nr:AAA family ATPase [Kiritimatiellia bacterium]